MIHRENLRKYLWGSNTEYFSKAEHWLQLFTSRGSILNASSCPVPI